MSYDPDDYPWIGRLPRIIRRLFDAPLHFAVFRVGSVALVTAIGLLSLAWVLIRGDGAQPPPWSGSVVSRLEVCPGDDPDPWYGAAQGWVGAGWTVPAIAPGPCEGRPPVGTVYLRRGGRDGEDGTAALRDLDGRVSSGVVEMDAHPDRQCSRAHELGHVLGLGHTLAATSVMASPCGTSWALLQRDLYPEAP